MEKKIGELKQDLESQIEELKVIAPRDMESRVEGWSGELKAAVDKQMQEVKIAVDKAMLDAKAAMDKDVKPASPEELKNLAEKKI